MTGDNDLDRTSEAESNAYPPQFLDPFAKLLAAAGWHRSGAFSWQRQKKMGQVRIDETIALQRDRSGGLPMLHGNYRYIIDGDNDHPDDDVIYAEDRQIAPIPLATADPAQVAAALLSFSAQDRLLLAARAAWSFGDARPRLRELQLQPGWLRPTDYPQRSGRWARRWEAGGDEWLITTLELNVDGDNPLLRYERYRGVEPDAAAIASGTLPLDPLADVGGTFAAFAALIGAPTTRS